MSPDNTNLLYNLGCGMVSLSEMTMALELFEPVFARAQTQNLTWFRTDNSLDPICDDPRFKALVERAEARLAGSPHESQHHA
jgi:hypothetical protein